MTQEIANELEATAPTEQMEPQAVPVPVTDMTSTNATEEISASVGAEARTSTEVSANTNSSTNADTNAKASTGAPASDGAAIATRADASGGRPGFDDHQAFHRTAFAMAAGGGLAGLAAHVATQLLPSIGTTVAPLPLAAVVGAAVYSAAPSKTRARATDLAGVIIGTSIIAAAFAAVQRAEMSPSWGSAIFAVMAGLLIARGLDGKRMLVVAGGGVAAALLARFVMVSFAGIEAGPSWLVAGGAGLAFGAVAVLGVLPRHLLWQAADPMMRAGRGGEPRRRGDRGEAASLLARARAAEAEPRIKSLLDQLAALDRDAHAAPSVTVLNARAVDLMARVAATSDPIAREEYEKAHAAVLAQLGDVEAIGHGRERVLARLHHELAASERSRLSITSTEADAISRAVVEAGDPTAP